MNKLRFIFTKGDDVKYIGHLDLIEVFDRAFRRSKVPLSFSGGFNPRPKLTFAHPLAAGIMSIYELAEVELETHIEENDFIEKMNMSLPGAIRVLKAYYVDDKKALMAQVVSSEYKVILEGEGITKDVLEKFFNQNEIYIDKKNKKKEIIATEVKKLILSYKIEGNVLWLTLVTGNEQSLRPDLLIKKIPGIEDYSICREKINLG